MIKETPFDYISIRNRIRGTFFEIPESDEGKGGTSDLPIIICHAFAEERKCSYRALVDFARICAGNGTPCVLFDYSCSGESDGDFENTRLESHRVDLRHAIELVKHRYNAKHVGVMGIRWGAWLGMLAAEDDSDVKMLILWEPLESLHTQITSMLGWRALFTRKNGAIDCKGYLVPWELYHDTKGLESKCTTNFKESLLCVKFSPGSLPGILKKRLESYSRNGARIDLQNILTPAIWRSIELPLCRDVIVATTKWIIETQVRHKRTE